MKELAGLTRQNCATACSESGCVLAAGRPLCFHPCKGGAPEKFATDPKIQKLQAEARELLGVKKHALQGAA